MFLFYNNGFISLTCNKYDVTKAIVGCKIFTVRLLAGNNHRMCLAFDQCHCKSTYDELLVHFLSVSIENRNCRNVDYF